MKNSKFHLCALVMSICFLFEVQASSWVGTKEDPRPLKSWSRPENVQVPYTLFLFDSFEYKVYDKDTLIFEGIWQETESTVNLENMNKGKVAFANKVFITQNGKEKVCLQTVFYKGPYQYRGEIFCSDNWE